MGPVYSVSVGERGRTASIGHHSLLLLTLVDFAQLPKLAKAIGERSHFKRRVGTSKGELPSSFFCMNHPRHVPCMCVNFVQDPA